MNRAIEIWNSSILGRVLTAICLWFSGQWQRSRVVRAFVAPMAGRQAAEHVRRRAGRAVEVAGKDLTDAQRDTFYGALDSICGNLRVLTKEGIPE